MKERPILFTGEMVRAILDGRKTQTRMPFKFKETNQPPSRPELFNPKHVTQPAPLGTIGDRLWVRETWGLMAHHDPTDWFQGGVRGMNEDCIGVRFSIEHRANWKTDNECARWRPSIHMPRWASRIDLEITAVRVERVQDITEEDARKEGVESGIWEREAQLLAGATDADDEELVSFRDGFGFLWQSIYANWDANPWVWVYEFRRIKP